MSVLVAAILAVIGFVVLVVLHELGHFAVAKAVGMRVERFSLFFPPLLLRKRIGETEYAIGAIPAGGYVRISGMNPSEELPDEIRTRAYYSQPVWKRIAVILAGPAMNFVLGFALFVAFFWLVGVTTQAPVVGQVSRGFPAAGAIERGDRLVSIDGRGGSADQLSARIAADRCPQAPPVAHCHGSRPLSVVVVRRGQRIELRLTPVYDPANHKMRLGFGYDPNAAGPRRTEDLGRATSDAASKLSSVSRITASLPARIFKAQERKQIHGIVGSYETTRQTLLHDPGDAVGLLAVISLALAVVNLFPFLPLDGGHVFWALVELVRRKPVSFSVMERSSFVGFALVMMLFLIGFTNDIHTLSNGGFGPTR